MNAKHRRFCEGIVSGKTAGQAYMDAGYDAQGQSAYVSASRLMNNVKIKERIKKMMDKTESSTIKTVKERKEMLSRIMDNAEANDKLMDAIRASAELSKMDGAYEHVEQLGTIKINIGGDDKSA
jgi:phage terminase small subunit